MTKNKYNIEVGLISKLLETKDITTVKDMQIRPMFFSGENKKVFKYLNDTYMQSGSLPTVRVFKQKFPNFELETYTTNEGQESVGTEEPLKYWCNEARNKVKHNKIVDSVEDIASKLEGLNTDEAYELMKKTVLYVENEVVETTSVNITENLDERKRLYLERKENKGMLGIPTGFDKLDYILKGMQKKQLITLLARTGIGKANPRSTPVLTPNGFIPMGEIRVGSLVIGEDGKPYPVTAIYPQGVKDVYEITFHDGTKSRSCKEHLWKYKTTDDKARGKDWRVDTLETMMSKPLKRGRGYHLVIPVNKAVEFYQEESPPIPPYTFGALLGDGGFTTDRISLTNSEQDIIERCNEELTHWGEFILNQATDCQHLFKSNDSKCNSLYRAIKEMGLQGVKSKDKYIPKRYLHSSVANRRDLLAGLMDTDGSVTTQGSQHFSSTSNKLIQDVAYLVRSLGYRCTIREYDRTSEGKPVEYRLVILTDDIITRSNKHRLSKNKIPVRRNKRDYEVLKVVNIEKVTEEECQCISVDSEDHTYLIDDFIVTHNTWLECIIGAYAQLQGYRVLQFTTEMSEEQMQDRYEAILLAKIMGEFNYSRFKSGTLFPEEEERYFNFLDNKLPKLEPLIIETATDVTGVSAKIDQHQPDIVFVDGAYLMQDDRGAKEDWLRVAHITRDLKVLAKTKKLPIFINTQADSNTSVKTGPELENIGFAKSIGHESDVVMALFQDEQMREDREMKLKILKQREGVLGNVIMNWDFSRMDFSPIYATSEEGQDSKTNSQVDKQDRGVIDIDN